MSMLKYIDPQTGKVWFERTEREAQFFIPDDNMLKTLCDWKGPTPGFQLTFTTSPDVTENGYLFYGAIVKVGTPPCNATLYKINMDSSWWNGIRSVLKLLNEYVIRERATPSGTHTEALLREISPGVAEIVPERVGSELWRWIGGAEVGVMEAEAKYPHVTNGRLYVPTDMKAQAVPFCMDLEDMLRLNNRFANARTQIADDAKKREQLKGLLADREFINTFDPVPRHFLEFVATLIQ